MEQPGVAMSPAKMVVKALDAKIQVLEKVALEKEESISKLEELLHKYVTKSARSAHNKLDLGQPFIKQFQEVKHSSRPEPSVTQSKQMIAAVKCVFCHTKQDVFVFLLLNGRKLRGKDVRPVISMHGCNLRYRSTSACLPANRALLSINSKEKDHTKRFEKERNNTNLFRVPDVTSSKDENGMCTVAVCRLDAGELYYRRNNDSNSKLLPHDCVIQVGIGYKDGSDSGAVCESSWVKAAIPEDDLLPEIHCSNYYSVFTRDCVHLALSLQECTSTFSYSQEHDRTLRHTSLQSGDFDYLGFDTSASSEANRSTSSRGPHRQTSEVGRSRPGKESRQLSIRSHITAGGSTVAFKMHNDAIIVTLLTRTPFQLQRLLSAFRLITHTPEQLRSVNASICSFLINYVSTNEPTPAVPLGDTENLTPGKRKRLGRIETIAKKSGKGAGADEASSNSRGNIGLSRLKGSKLKRARVEKSESGNRETHKGYEDSQHKLDRLCLAVLHVITRMRF